MPREEKKEESREETTISIIKEKEKDERNYNLDIQSLQCPIQEVQHNTDP